MEQWKKVSECDTLYYVSDCGRVKNRFGKVLKQQPCHNGYMRVRLMINGKQTWKRVSVLVAKAFIPQGYGKSHVNHINGIKEDNRIENLEWVTPKENVQHSIKTGLRKHFNSNGAKPVNQYTLDGKYVTTFASISEAQRVTGVDTSKISAVCKGRRRKTGGSKWAYAYNGENHKSKVIEQ